MDNMHYVHPSCSEYKTRKSDQCAQPHPENHILPEHSLQQPRAVKRRRIEMHNTFLAIVFEDDGRPQFRSSTNLRHAKQALLQPLILQMQEYLTGSNTADDNTVDLFGPPMEEPAPRSAQPHQSAVSYPFLPKRRRVESEPADDQSLPDGVLQDAESSSLLIRQPSGNGAGAMEMPIKKVTVNIRLDDTKRWRQWFADTFMAIQQQACRIIAKEWIKAIHPKKQSTHPYNGNMPRSLKQSPERTKPPYWPSGVDHKEPDHIPKWARTELLVHIIMNTPQREIVPDMANSDKVYTAEDLMHVLEMKAKQERDVLKKWELVQSVISVRTHLENYEAGGFDGDGFLTVSEWSDSRNSNPKKKKKKPNPNANANVSLRGEDDENSDENDVDVARATIMPTTESGLTYETDANADGPEQAVQLTTSFSSSNDSHETTVKAVQPPHGPSPQKRFEHCFPASSQPVNRAVNENHSVDTNSFPHHGVMPNQHFPDVGWQSTALDQPIPGSYEENIMLVPDTMTGMNHARYEDVIQSHNHTDMLHGMLSATPYNNEHHYQYGMDPGIQRSFSMSVIPDGQLAHLSHAYSSHEGFYHL